MYTPVSHLRTILIPTDFSEVATRATDYALELAAQKGARVILMHAYYTPPVATSIPRELVDTMEAEKRTHAEQHLRQEAVRAARIAPTVDVSIHAESGEAIESIVRAAETLQASLIVLGTAGEKSISESILGSVATRVMESAACPVLTVPTTAGWRPIRQIAFACSPEDAAGEVLTSALEWAAPLRATIHCVYVGQGEEAQAESARMQARIADLQAAGKAVALSIRPEHDLRVGLMRCAEEIEADLIALVPRRRYRASDPAHETLLHHMTMHSRIPLLAFHF
ncbi:MAG: universal stress protein [Bacteroidia bacterium]|nr:universal stress protein [Bacteroidia bacterium]